MIKYLILAILLTGCSPTDLATTAAKSLIGSDDGVSVEAQVGKENRKAIVLGTSEEVKGDKIEKMVETQSVEKMTINQTPLWVIILLVIGWVLPSPQEIARNIINLFRKNK